MDTPLWRPFTQMKTAPQPLLIESGKGALLYASDGRTYIDANSSWWVTLHGHAHPAIAKRIAAQAYQLEQVILADCVHPPALTLANRLLQLLPGDMSKVFFSDNGSTAVETALKMALQHRNRHKIAALRGSYHGDTFGAMSAGGKTPFKAPFWPYLFEVELIDLEKGEEQLIPLIERQELACFIYEPIVFGVRGMQIHLPELFNPLLKRCKQAGVITIADEALTGFGRMGPLFASELIEVKPDIICLCKGLTGGFLPLGATVCTTAVYAPFHSEDRSKALLHGHSYSGNPLACVSALASLDLLLDPGCIEKRHWIAKQHVHFAARFHDHPKLLRCTSLGTLLVFEVRDPFPNYFTPLRDTLFHFALERGVLLRPLGNVLYVLPPYCITEAQLQTIYQTLEESLTCIA